MAGLAAGDGAGSCADSILVFFLLFVLRFLLGTFAALMSNLATVPALRSFFPLFDGLLADLALLISQRRWVDLSGTTII
jgi:hypothetical protein